MERAVFPTKREAKFSTPKFEGMKSEKNMSNFPRIWNPRRFSDVQMIFPAIKLQKGKSCSGGMGWSMATTVQFWVLVVVPSGFCECFYNWSCLKFFCCFFSTSEKSYQRKSSDDLFPKAFVVSQHAISFICSLKKPKTLEEVKYFILILFGEPSLSKG